MKILFIGDIVGRPGRQLVRDALPRLVDAHMIDLVVVNVENAAAGFGLTPDVVTELFDVGIDVMTTGNHVWDQREIIPVFDQEPRLLRPANFPAGTPGMRLEGVEKKLGIRASDTTTLVFENCRIPASNLLGKAEVKKKGSGDKGFKGAMATFDASRPIVAAMAVGVGRAALDLVVEELAARGVTVRYDAPLAAQTAIERDVMEMQAQLQAARLLTWRAAAMMNRGKPNNL